MKLTIPISFNNKVYTEAEIRKPRGGVIADTQEALDREGSFQAMLEFVSGSIKSFTDESGNIEEANIKKICLEMPYLTCEDLAIKIMASVNGDDKIEGIYSCPLCHKEVFCQVSNGEDTRDKMSDLEVSYLDPYVNNIHVELSEPILIQSKAGETVQEIHSIDLRWPTISDCIAASKKFTEKEAVRLQYSIYVSAIIRVNDGDIQPTWKNTWGMFVFNKMETEDIQKISNELKKYGMKKTIRRRCMGCGKEWDSVISTDSFFVLGLRQE